MSKEKVNYKVVKKSVYFSPTYRKGNIEQIMHLIKQGLTYDEIWAHASLWITSARFNEYYGVAQRTIEAEKHEQKQK